MKNFGSTSGLTVLAEDQSIPANGMVAYVTSSYNSGYQNGDIKLATLSDTDDTDVTGSELVTNGTFDTDISGWVGSAASYDSANQRIKVTGGGSNLRTYQLITNLVVGQTYVLNMTVTGPANAYISTNTSSSGFIAEIGYSGSYSNTPKSVTFTATATSLYVVLYVIGTFSYFDNVSVRLAEEDRSVNGNGLQVFGTVTKNPVATGADLVAYSGFSGSNWLNLPYQSWMDIGTGDICFMGWIKHSQTDATRVFMSVGNETVDNNRMAMYSMSDGTVRFILRQNSLEDVIASSSGAISDGAWHHIVGLRSNGTGQLYVDGKTSGSSVSSTKSIVQTGTSLKIGVDYNHSGGSSNAIYASMALWRVSATAPSPEQIAKIYNDEKVLFQENAQATLYGTSDAVTALAHDDATGILSVGTSAGRSDFQGLRRVNNTTTAVWVAISASNGMIVEE